MRHAGAIPRSASRCKGRPRGALTQLDTELEVALWYLAPIAGALVGLITWLATDAWQDAGATESEDTRRAWTAALGGFGGTLLAAHGFAFAIRE